ncbi:hypothetical protein HYALB_00005259 [Hymenoscyphus albidus]|uniref:Uncharacterized protein n=1 Tax=Hymenoscyphus albidus TaxID=595503 RepID=A0A9N9LUT2_9HELO|nr:hypothetical protein HYALB_00005259 [Hymenoscyphus albidus]
MADEDKDLNQKTVLGHDDWGMFSTTAKKDKKGKDGKATFGFDEQAKTEEHLVTQPDSEFSIAGQGSGPASAVPKKQFRHSMADFELTRQEFIARGEIIPPSALQEPRKLWVKDGRNAAKDVKKGMVVEFLPDYVPGPPADDGPLSHKRQLLNASSTSGRATSQEIEDAEISFDSIVEGGRRKRAKVENSQLPLFAPSQIPAGNVYITPSVSEESRKPRAKTNAPTPQNSMVPSAGHDNEHNLIGIRSPSPNNEDVAHKTPEPYDGLSTYPSSSSGSRQLKRHREYPSSSMLEGSYAIKKGRKGPLTDAQRKNSIGTGARAVKTDDGSEIRHELRSQEASDAHTTPLLTEEGRKTSARRKSSSTISAFSNMRQENDSTSAGTNTKLRSPSADSRLSINLEVNSHTSSSTSTTTITAPDVDSDWNDDSADLSSVLDLDDEPREERISDPKAYFQNLAALERPPAVSTPLSVDSEEIIALIRSTKYDKLLNLWEMYNLAVRAWKNVTCLQNSGFCGVSLSLLAMDQDRTDVAKILRLDVQPILELVQDIEDILKTSVIRISQIQKVASTRRSANWYIESQDRERLVTTRSMGLLSPMGLLLHFPSMHLYDNASFIWQCAFQTLDLITLSYAGTHIQRFDLDLMDIEVESLQIPRRFIYHDKTLRDIASSVSCFKTFSYRRRRLQCLDKLLGIVTYKRRGGHTMKDALVERWRHNFRNPMDLEAFSGVEISLCTGNARRRRLLHLLGSPTIRNYLHGIAFPWISKDCEYSYFKALRCPKSFRRFWKGNPDYRENVGNAISTCLDALEETGVNEESRELRGFWVDSFDSDGESDGESDDRGDQQPSTSGPDKHFSCFFEEWIVTLFRSEYTWTGFLEDSEKSLTMAVVGMACLDFDHGGYGRRCSQAFCTAKKSNSRAYPVLQTSLQLNDSILKSEKLKRGKLDRAGKIVWDATDVRKGTSFSLGDHGTLKVLTPPSDTCPLIVEWNGVKSETLKEVKNVAINEKLLGRNAERHHREHTRGTWESRPLPVLVLSKSAKTTLSH